MWGKKFILKLTVFLFYNEWLLTMWDVIEMTFNSKFLKPTQKDVLKLSVYITGEGTEQPNETN